MLAQSNNSLPNIRRNSGDFVDVVDEIARLSCTCVCFRSLLLNELTGQCIWNIQGAGLIGGKNRAGSASCMSAKADPQERTPSRLRVDPEQTQNGPRADSEGTPSGPKADANF